MRTDAEKSAEQEAIAAGYQFVVNSDRRRQERDGVVVTPVQVVDFQIRSVIEKLKLQGRDPDDCVEWLDPFGGTGIYTARLLQIVELPPERKWRLSQNCIVIEIDCDVARICANNLAAVVREETGRHGNVRVICVDTFELDPRVDLWGDEFASVQPALIGEVA